jgi:hypothetical protein
MRLQLDFDFLDLKCKCGYRFVLLSVIELEKETTYAEVENCFCPACKESIGARKWKEIMHRNR